MKPIFVTQPSMPPLEEFNNYLKEIWSSKIITNAGKFHVQLEEELSSYLGIKHISLVSNGTLALIIAIKALDLTGEVITTPYSYVATAHSINWNGLKPVFADIEEDGFNLDPKKIEALITPKTSAIIPVHVYGVPCNIEAIQEIAEKYKLKVIYDAAHAFGVECENNSILNFGNLSVLSFHATKVYNTFEGGAIISNTMEAKVKIDYLKNCGYENENTVVSQGINAKMNEVQAAFGLLQLKYIDSNIEKRNLIYDRYCDLLCSVSGIRFLSYESRIKSNYSYFPILVDQNAYGLTRDDLYEILKSEKIYARKYFYPLISEFEPYRSNLLKKINDDHRNAYRTSRSVLCLPIYSDLSIKNVERIAKIIIAHSK